MAVIAGWRRAGNIYVPIVIVSLVTAPLAFMTDRLLLGQVLDWDGKAFRPEPPVPGQLLLSFHDAARSVGHAAGPSGAAGRSGQARRTRWAAATA